MEILSTKKVIERYGRMENMLEKLITDESLFILKCAIKLLSKIIIKATSNTQMIIKLFNNG